MNLVVLSPVGLSSDNPAVPTDDGAGVDAEGAVFSVELVELITVKLPIAGGGREAAAGTGVSGTSNEGCRGR